MKSWEPRRPSAKIERRLFPRAQGRTKLPAFQWLAPAGVCLLLALVAVRQENTHPALSGSDAAIPMILSNPSAAGPLPGDGSLVQHNNVPVTFEWTNRGGLTSSVGFMSFRLSTN